MKKTDRRQAGRRLKNILFYRHLIYSIFISLALLIHFPEAHATQVELQITKQALRKMDIAVAPLKNANPSVSGSLQIFDETLSFDLVQSGYFEPVNHPKEIQNLSNMESHSTLTQGPQWKALGADILVKGSYSVNGVSGTLEVFAFDVDSGRRIFGKRYSFQQNNVWPSAHQCANDLIYQLTGERGISGTRIAYVAGGPGSKEVFICDADGKNVRQLTRDASITLGISWDPSGQKLLYTSFKEGQARVYLHDLTRGERHRLASYPGLNAAAKFSPDGSRVALVLSKDGNPEVYISDLQGKNPQRITNHPGVDTSPTWSPDGQKIVFVSDRSRRPHLYLQNLKGGPLRRLTHQGNYNSSPAWSPKGDRIAFSSDMEGGFKICVLDLTDETITIVSQEGGEADEPEWAPDGRHIVYSSKVRGMNHLFIVDTYDGKTTRLSSNNVHHLTPAWSR